SVGRGRSKEADIAWGEKFVGQVAEKGKLSVHQDVVQGPDEDRLKTPYYIGAPLRHGKNIVGVLTMIRFGGPEYTESDKQAFT
ncbi:hypothetical protein DF186_21540, partial [Enterococcus hirae]